MAQTGLGLALKTLREKKALSLREFSQQCCIDHAYVYRLETGEKKNPSTELIDKLLTTLTPCHRETAIVRWLVHHVDTTPEMVAYALACPEIDVDVLQVAASINYRGTARPEPAILFARALRFMAADTEDD